MARNGAGFPIPVMTTVVHADLKFINLLRYLPQSVGRDGDDTLWTLLRAKARGVLQTLVRQGRQVESILVVVTQPGATAHGEDGLVTLHPDAEKLDGSRTQVTCSRVGQVTRDRVQDRSQ